MKICPPATLVRGLTELKRDLYKRILKIPAAQVPAAKVGRLRAALSRDLVLTVPRVKTVVPTADQDSNTRLLLLNPEEIEVRNESFILKSSQATLEPFLEHAAEAVIYDLILDYSYWSSDEILSATLPEGMDIPSSFETVGHIAHLNLRNEQDPFKRLIGAVILDKNPAIRTVVNKVGNIESTFRFFQMEVLAGENNMEVEVKEGGCIFNFDYSQVYWNSRLQMEHHRLIDSFNPRDRVCDLFCGVGPFAIPAAKKGCIVYANDLNPESVKYLKVNQVKNKIPTALLKPFNMDARDFVMHSHSVLNPEQPDQSADVSPTYFNHYIMNLPASAHEFLDAFLPLRKLMTQRASDAVIRVHCYVFCKADASPIELVESQLKSKDSSSVAVAVLNEKTTVAHLVRNVAPNKNMFCVSFDLPPFLEPSSKRLKYNQ